MTRRCLKWLVDLGILTQRDDAPTTFEPNEQYFDGDRVQRHQSKTEEELQERLADLTYREDWGGSSWMCRWDRHDNPHSARDHYHQPPDARTTDAIDREYPLDIFKVLDRVFKTIDDRLGAVWEECE